MGRSGDGDVRGQRVLDERDRPLRRIRRDPLETAGARIAERDLAGERRVDDRRDARPIPR